MSGFGVSTMLSRTPVMVPSHGWVATAMMAGISAIEGQDTVELLGVGSKVRLTTFEVSLPHSFVTIT